MSRHPIEALLRPPVELWSMLVAFATATIAVLAPWALMMPPGVAYGAGAALGILGLIRGRQAWRVMRYQRNMRRLPTYRLKSTQIPVSQRKLFLGKGFRWSQKHTQRLRDTIRPEVQHYVQPGPLYRWARRQEVTWESVPLLSLLARLFQTRAWWNPLSPLPPVGGKPALHAVEPDEQAVWMDIGEQVGHTLVLGTTRVGKTRLAEILITQDIRRGDVVIVFDSKVEVFTLMSVSGVDDSSDPGSGVDFKSRNEDRISVSEVPLLTPAELITLPKGQAFALLEGGQLWKLRMPLPVEDTDIPETLTEIANEMERTYITNDQWYRVQEPWWAGLADTPVPSERETSDG